MMLTSDGNETQEETCTWASMMDLWVNAFASQAWSSEFKPLSTWRGRKRVLTLQICPFISLQTLLHGPLNTNFKT